MWVLSESNAWSASLPKPDYSYFTFKYFNDKVLDILNITNLRVFLYNTALLQKKTPTIYFLQETVELRIASKDRQCLGHPKQSMISSFRVRMVSGNRGGIKGQKKGDKDLRKFCVVRQRWRGGTESRKVKKVLVKMISASTENQEAKLCTGQTTGGEGWVIADISLSVTLVLMSAAS